MKKTLNRRAFLRGMGALALAPVIVPSSAFGANDRIAVGYIGVGRRAQDLLRLPKDMAGVAAADIYAKRLEKFKAQGWKVFADYRELLADPSIDAVVVATPDHWHILPSIHACGAGKDVYVEKPLSLTVREGRLLSDAARKNNRIVQVGSQQRSIPVNRAACALVRDGALGALKEVHAANYPSPWDCDLPEQPVPEGLNWDVWFGQTQPRPYHEDLFLPRANGRKDAQGRPLGWISFKPWSGGEMTGWGAHGLDQIQWALGMDASGPVEVWADGTELTSPVHMRYASGLVVHLDGKGDPGGAKFVGEKGSLDVMRANFATDNPEVEKALKAEMRPKFNDTLAHIENWRDCIRSRQLPAADIEIGHRSCTVCHLGNIARWTGRPLKWDPAAERFVDDAEADRLLRRDQRAPWGIPGNEG